MLSDMEGVATPIWLRRPSFISVIQKTEEHFQSILAFVVDKDAHGFALNADLAPCA
jgi:hypothetical protein